MLSSIALDVANSSLRLLLDLVSAPGLAERLVRENGALLWLSPLTHHQRPNIALKASLAVAILLHLTPPIAEPAFAAAAEEALASAISTARAYGQQEGGLDNLSPRCIRIFAAIVTSQSGGGSHGDGAAESPAAAWTHGLQMVGLHALAQLVQSSVTSADWTVLQGLGGGFFSTLTQLCSDGARPEKMSLAAAILTALGHALPTIHLPPPGEGWGRGGSDHSHHHHHLHLPGSGRGGGRRGGGALVAPAYLGLHLLSRPVREWDSDAVCLWVGGQAFREHLPAFRESWVNGRVLLMLTDELLREMGIERPVHRRAILVALERLACHAEQGAMPLQALSAAAAAEGGGVGEACDVFLATPCEGGAALAAMLRQQLLALGARVSGWAPGAPLLVLTPADSQQGTSAAAVPSAAAGSADGAAAAEARTAALIASATLFLTVLAPRTLALGESVTEAVAALPTCLPSQLHAALVRETSAAVRYGKPVLGVATAAFTWPGGSSEVEKQLRAALAPPELPGSAAVVAAERELAAALPLAPGGAAAGAGAAGAGEGGAALQGAALAQHSSSPPPTDGSTAFALPPPNRNGGVLVQLRESAFLMASSALAAGVMAHVGNLQEASSSAGLF